MSAPTATVDPFAAVEEWREEREAIPKDEDRRVSKLAPGMVSQELVGALARKYTPEEMMAWAEELRHATFKGHPDYRTRTAAFKLMCEYLIGRPIERIESININLDADAATGLVERLAKSPALREQVRKALEAAEVGGTVVEVGSNNGSTDL